MTDSAFIVAAYAVILGGMALYTVVLWRRLAALTRDRDDEAR